MALPHPRVQELRQEEDTPGHPGLWAASISKRASASATDSGFADDRSSQVPKKVKRGRKPFPVSDNVKRGLIRIICYTDVPFDHIASAVEQAGGKGKQWLRKLLQDSTGTGPGSGLLLGDIRLGDKSSNERRQREQEAAFKLATRRGSSQATSIPLDHQEGSTQDVRYPATTRPPTEVIQSQRGTTPSVQGLRAETSVSCTEEQRNSAERSFSMSSIARNLEKITKATPGLYRFIGRQRSETANTIASRLSFRLSFAKRSSSGRSTSPEDIPLTQQNLESGSSEPLCSSSNSEYVRLYHYPIPSDATCHTTQLDGRILQSAHTGSAVSCIRDARDHSMASVDAESLLRARLPPETEAAKTFVNETDINGVSALHLAVAFGLNNLCDLLVQKGADGSAVTKSGTSVYHFAKPAQKLAKHDLRLYSRIVYLRQWAKYGGTVPVPRVGDHGLSHAQMPSNYQRSETTSTLDTVLEKPGEESYHPTRSGSVNERGVKRKANIPLDRVSCGNFYQVPGAYFTWDSEGGLDYLPRRTDSPESYASSRMCKQRVQSGKPTQRQITARASSPYVRDFGSRVQNLAGPPGHYAAPSSNVAIQTSGHSDPLTRDSPASIENLLRVVFENSPSGPDAHHDSYRTEVKPSQQLLETSDPILPPDTPYQYPQQHSRSCQPMMCMGACSSISHQNPYASNIIPMTNSYIQQRSERQPSYSAASDSATEPQFGDFEGDTLSNKALDDTQDDVFIPMLDPTSVMWFSCMHGRPRNYYESLCQYCPRMGFGT